MVIRFTSIPRVPVTPHLLAGSCVVVRWVLGREFGAEIVQAQPKAHRRLREWVRLMAAKR